jgi:hypothetical protein
MFHFKKGGTMQVAKVLIATLGLGRKESDRKNEDVVREYKKTVYTINADSQEKDNYETPFRCPLYQ